MSTILVTPSTMPRAVMLARIHQCQTCPTPCQSFTAGTINHARPEEGCPLRPEPRWLAWAALQIQQRARRKGWGDRVHEVAHPVAVLVDSVLPTDLANCSGCARRRQQLNATGHEAARRVRTALTRVKALVGSQTPFHTSPKASKNG